MIPKVFRICIGAFVVLLTVSGPIWINTHFFGAHGVDLATLTFPPCWRDENATQIANFNQQAVNTLSEWMRG